jgi:hypothetical protein
MNNKMQQFCFIYSFLIALQVSGDVFAHHQEQLSLQLLILSTDVAAGWYGG